jgi:hypothetical protein
VKSPVAGDRRENSAPSGSVDNDVTGPNSLNGIRPRADAATSAVEAGFRDSTTCDQPRRYLATATGRATAMIAAVHSNDRPT